MTTEQKNMELMQTLDDAFEVDFCTVARGDKARSSKRTCSTDVVGLMSQIGVGK